jgi:hypothetical protein
MREPRIQKRLRALGFAKVPVISDLIRVVNFTRKLEILVSQLQSLKVSDELQRRSGGQHENSK